MQDYVVIDLEMTGLNVKTDHILEVGAVKVRNHHAVDQFGAILRQNIKIPEKVTELTGITETMVQEGAEKENAMKQFFEFIGDDIIVGQNVIFDYSFLKQWAVNHNMPLERNAVDTLKLARKFLPREQKKDLESLCAYFGVKRENAHRAFHDAYETWQVYEALRERYEEEHAEDFLPKPLLYKVKKQTPATARQMKYLREYAAHYQIKLPDDLAEMTRSEASRLTDQLIARHGKLQRKKSGSQAVLQMKGVYGSVPYHRKTGRSQLKADSSGLNQNQC